MSSCKSLSDYKNIKLYNETVQLLRSFFLSKGFLEVDTQSRQSILAACEDPSNITDYYIGNQRWPLPQTGQMWLEYELLNNPDLPGLFCLTTSYRNEKNPNPSRHLRVFPMFEFESSGSFTDLQNIIKELLQFLGFGKTEQFKQGLYEEMAKRLNTSIIEATHEEQIAALYGPVFLLEKFPLRTQPFWNMKQEQEIAFKIDTLLYGIETIGAAERSTDPVQMKQSFLTISNGTYAQLLYNQFGKERVNKELEAFLALPFCKRFGGGIGIDRLIRAISLTKETTCQIGPVIKQQSSSFQI